MPGDNRAPAARCSALRPAGCAGTHVEHLHQLTSYCNGEDWLARSLSEQGETRPQESVTLAAPAAAADVRIGALLQSKLIELCL